MANRWWVVVASACGLLVGAGPINVFAFGVFLKPVSAALGIPRGVLSSALFFNTTLHALACPLVGWLIDRWGIRRVMMPGIVLFALAVAGYGSMQAGDRFLMFAVFGVAGVVGAVQTPIPYATVIARWFDRERGLALGIAMAGVGMGVAIIPQLAGYLIDQLGWRRAYVGLAIAVVFVAWLPVTVFLRDPPREREAGRDAPPPANEELPGTSVADAVRSDRFWTLTIAFLLGVMAINGTLTHVVALLTDRGVSPRSASGALSAAGLAIVLGRIASGWCLDRYSGPYVAICFFALPMVGIALLGCGAGGTVPLVGAVLCGMGIGAEVDLMAFFVSRYFGLRAYGEIYGLVFAVFSVGTGLGPALSGRSFDVFQTYGPIFAAYEIALAATCALFLRLGPYPYPARSRS